MKLTFYKDKKKQWRWRLQANNNRIVGASTEGFKQLRDCEYNFDLQSCFTVTRRVYAKNKNGKKDFEKDQTKSKT